MQILLNLGVVGQAVLEHMRNRIVLEEGEVLHVELTDEGATVHVLPEGVSPEGSDDNNDPTPTGERPVKKPRRSKAQIEADNKAEAERKALADSAGTAEPGNDAASTDKPVAEAASAAAEAVGETTPEASGDGEAQSETTADPIVETAVAVETTPEPVAEAEPDLTPEEEPVRKPTTSLFANLRKPNNQ